MRSAYWDKALLYWGYIPPIGDLNIAQRLWAELVENGEHINPIEYPNKPIGGLAPYSDRSSVMLARKKLTIPIFCGNISITEKQSLAIYCIASAGFLPQQQQVLHEKTLSQEVAIQKFRF